MCLILDASKYGDFLNPDNKDMHPVKKWVEKKGKIVYSPTQKFESELTGKIRTQFEHYTEAGKIKRIDKKLVEDQQNNLPKLKSNDPHIIALAKVAKVRLLVTGDKNLSKDFKSIIPKGKVYQNKTHALLLTNASCP